MSDFKAGDIVEVSQYSDFRDASPREFVWANGGNSYCINTIHAGKLTHWPCIRAIKEPEYTKYTQDTLPKGVVYVRAEGWDSMQMILNIRDDGVDLKTTIVSYSKLLERYEISTDLCKTWQTAGMVKP